MASMPLLLVSSANSCVFARLPNVCSRYSCGGNNAQHSALAYRVPFVAKRNSTQFRVFAARTRPGQRSSTTEQKKTREEEADEEDALAEAALEALFQQLEKDLDEGSLSGEEEDIEVTEEELNLLENEFAAAELPDFDEVEKSPEKSNQKSLKIGKKAAMFSTDEEEVGDDAAELLEDEPRTVSLEMWQLRKLAAAALIGRRKVNVRALAAETRLDRADVLAWLKNPPPELLMLEASGGLDEDGNNDAKSIVNAKEISKAANELARNENESEVDMQATDGPQSWHNRKRVRKVHIATFELVYRKTKRPSNAMIQNLVDITHVPRRRIVQWFDRKRTEKLESSFETRSK